MYKNHSYHFGQWAQSELYSTESEQKKFVSGTELSTNQFKKVFWNKAKRHQVMIKIFSITQILLKPNAGTSGTWKNATMNTTSIQKQFSSFKSLITKLSLSVPYFHLSSLTSKDSKLLIALGLTLSRQKLMLLAANCLGFTARMAILASVQISQTTTPWHEKNFTS